MKQKVKFGLKQWYKPAPKTVTLWVDLSTYILVGFSGFSFVSDHPNLAYALSLIAGGVSKFVPRLFGVEDESEQA